MRNYKQKRDLTKEKGRMDEKLFYYVTTDKVLNGDKNSIGLGPKRLNNLENILLYELHKYEIKNNIIAECIIFRASIFTVGLQSYVSKNIKSNNRENILDYIFQGLTERIKEPVKLSKVEFIRDNFSSHRHVLLLEFKKLKSNIKYKVDIEFLIITQNLPYDKIDFRNPKLYV